jgi:hypothetical protein
MRNFVLKRGFFSLTNKHARSIMRLTLLARCRAGSCAAEYSTRLRADGSNSFAYRPRVPLNSSIVSEVFKSLPQHSETITKCKTRRRRQKRYFGSFLQVLVTPTSLAQCTSRCSRFEQHGQIRFTQDFSRRNMASRLTTWSRRILSESSALTALRPLRSSTTGGQGSNVNHLLRRN